MVGYVEPGSISMLTPLSVLSLRVFFALKLWSDSMIIADRIAVKSLKSGQRQPYIHLAH